MDIDHFDNANMNVSPGIFDENPRLKTSLRLRYEAEARVLREQLGGLEHVRGILGLTRRKMCQLMLVDPSTWTRWMKDETKVPPHILKALQWYLIVVEKYPVFHPQHQVTVAAAIREKTQDPELARVIEQRRILETRVIELERLAQRPAFIHFGWKVLLILNSIFLIWIVLRKF